jgi:hypothetical protein
LFLLLILAPLAAQDPRGAITGRVFDASGAAIPGAAIQVTNVDTNVKVSAASNAEGNYEILYLIPGTYKVEVAMTDNQGYDLSVFGFPKSLIAQMDPRGIAFPEIAVTGLLALGQDGGFNQINYSHSLLTTLNMVEGNHDLKFGFDGRLMLDNTTTYGNVAPHMEGIANHPNFAVPNVNPTAAAFGQITATQTGQEERRISLGLKLLF